MENLNAQHLRFAHVQASNDLKQSQKLTEQFEDCDPSSSVGVFNPALRSVALELTSTPVAHNKGATQIIKDGIQAYIKEYQDFVRWEYDTNVNAAAEDYANSADEYHAAALAEAQAAGYDIAFCGSVALNVTLRR
jgi:hypothetical protein